MKKKKKRSKKYESSLAQLIHLQRQEQIEVCVNG